MQKLGLKRIEFYKADQPQREILFMSARIKPERLRREEILAAKEEADFKCAEC